VPPFSRTFMGGEQDIRGFEIWGITPIAFIPSSGSVNVLNNDGSARTQKVVSNGVLVSSPVSMTVPTYQLITPGGDTQLLANFEYRIPIIAGRVRRFSMRASTRSCAAASSPRSSHVSDLNTQFPQAGFSGKVYIAPGTQKARASTRIELQVMLPVVNAHFACTSLTILDRAGISAAALVADRASFPNNARSQLNRNLRPGVSFFEKRTMFRFTIGRTF